MKVRSLQSFWDTERGEMSFEMSLETQMGVLKLAGSEPIAMAMSDWRLFGEFLTRGLKAAPSKTAIFDGPPSQAEPWSEEEDERLRQEFGFRVDVLEIAERHGRTRGAITDRLEHLGLLPRVRRKGAAA